MAAELDLNQLLERANALQQVASAAFAAATVRDGDAERREALLYSALHYLGEVGAGNSTAPDHAQQFACSLLELLEDSTGMGDLADAGAIYKAIAGVQEVLGVPEGQRAWVADDATPEPDRPADFFATVALSVLPQFMGEARRLVQPANRDEQEKLLQAVMDGLMWANETDNRGACIEALQAAERSLVESAEFWGWDRNGDTEQAWALYYGIEGAIRNGTEWVQERKYSAAFCDQEGEVKVRGALARECACEISQTAVLLQEVAVPSIPDGAHRPAAAMVRRIQRLANVILSACDDDMDSTDNLRKRME